MSVELELINQQIQFEGKTHPIEFGHPFELSPGFVIKPYTFKDEFGGKADGCVFTMEPLRSTRPALIAVPMTAYEVPIKGRGWFLAVNPQGEVELYDVDASEASFAVEYGKSWLIAWIASRSGMEVLNLNIPVFTDDMEVIVEKGAKQVSGISGIRIPEEFWEKYERLTSGEVVLPGDPVRMEGQSYFFDNTSADTFNGWVEFGMRLPFVYVYLEGQDGQKHSIHVSEIRKALGLKDSFEKYKEQQPERKTRLETRILEVGSTLHAYTHLGQEPTEPGYGYSVDLLQINGELQDTLDAAVVTVFPNRWTPPQLVERDGTIIDFPFKGGGTFICLHPDGKLEIVEFDGNNPDHNNLAVVYGKGCYILWKVGDGGLRFIELCSPPYKQGDLKTLDIDISSADIPEEFKSKYESLINNA